MRLKDDKTVATLTFILIGLFIAFFVFSLTGQWGLVMAAILAFFVDLIAIVWAAAKHNLRKKAEIKPEKDRFQAKRKAACEGNPHSAGALVAGVPGWDPGASVTATIDGDDLRLFNNDIMAEASLPLYKVFNVWSGTEKEVEVMQKGGGVIKGAVARALFNPFIGILVAANKKTKTREKPYSYVVISYHPEPDRDSAITLRSFYSNGVFNDSIDGFANELKDAVNLGAGAGPITL